MSKSPSPAPKNPASVQASKPKPKQAQIFAPGPGSTFTLSGKGGVADKTKTRPASKIANLKSDAGKKPAPTKPVTKPVTKKAAKPVPRPTHNKPKRNAPVPGRKIPKKAKKLILSPGEQTEKMAQSVVTSFTDRLTEEAVAKGGSLSLKDLQSLNKEFEQSGETLKVAFEKSFENYVVARDKASWSKSRKFPFDRMIVKTFSYMLEDDTRKLKSSDAVSRRILPGFFLALSMVLGPDKMESYQGKCRAVVKLVTKAYGDNFEWEDIYESDDARAIVIDALIDIAYSFEDIDKRAEWFIDLVNANLTPAEQHRNQAITDWTFTADGFKQFFRALIADLNDALESEGGCLLITRRHGVEVTIELVDLMKSLNIGLKGL